jgi:hypothetical protein
MVYAVGQAHGLVPLNLAIWDEMGELGCMGDIADFQLVICGQEIEKNCEISMWNDMLWI